MNEELKCWLLCYGEPLQLGALVSVTEESQCYTDFSENNKYMVTSIRATKGEGINIGINDNGDCENWVTEYDCFGINELTLIEKTKH